MSEYLIIELRRESVPSSIGEPSSASRRSSAARTIALTTLAAEYCRSISWPRNRPRVSITANETSPPRSPAYFQASSIHSPVGSARGFGSRFGFSRRPSSCSGSGSANGCASASPEAGGSEGDSGSPSAATVTPAPRAATRMSANAYLMAAILPAADAGRSASGI